MLTNAAPHALEPASKLLTINQRAQYANHQRAQHVKKKELNKRAQYINIKEIINQRVATNQRAEYVNMEEFRGLNM